MLFVIQILMTFVTSNFSNFVRSQSLINEQFCLIETSHLMSSLFFSSFKTFLFHFLTSHVVISRSSFFLVLIFIRRVYVKSCVIFLMHLLMLSWNLALFILQSHLETWFTDSCLEDCIMFISSSLVQYTHLHVQSNSFSEMMKVMTVTMKMTIHRNLFYWWATRKLKSFLSLWLARFRWFRRSFYAE
jgi:hypothetical protein